MKSKMKTIYLTSLILFALSFTCIATERNIQKSNPGEPSGQVVNNSEPSGKKTSEIKKLTLREKFRMYKEIRKEIKKTKKGGSDVPMVVLIILAIFLPPIAVGLYTNWDTPTLWNLLLWIFFIIPGIVHAFYILFLK
jgi:uncharacterized membrane protein YqaE (UPF0057 family)